MEYSLCLIAVILLLGLIGIASGARVVPEYQRLVVFRLGKPLGKAKGPGLVFLIPILDRAAKVDLREQKREVLDQAATTKDYKPVSFAFRWYYKVLDPVQSVLVVGNHEAATAGVASSKLRELVREINSNDLTAERERIRYIVNSHLEEITGQWGIKVTKFEISNISLGDQSK
ncbi:MAG TPA: SPFH domain-containing protein [Anaerolineales bacterium]|jgi:regulator of protease activity HflC (stomatin/prohibitin superfamily)|nr:SPFH domain-containing protein [Anaerolineales bacterium]